MARRSADEIRAEANAKSAEVKARRARVAAAFKQEQERKERRRVLFEFGYMAEVAGFQWQQLDKALVLGMFMALQDLGPKERSGLTKNGKEKLEELEKKVHPYHP